MNLTKRSDSLFKIELYSVVKADKRSGLNCVVMVMVDMKCDKKVRFTVQIGVVYWSHQVNPKGESNKKVRFTF